MCLFAATVHLFFYRAECLLLPALVVYLSSLSGCSDPGSSEETSEGAVSPVESALADLSEIIDQAERNVVEEVREK